MAVLQSRQGEDNSKSIILVTNLPSAVRAYKQSTTVSRYPVVAGYSGCQGPVAEQTRGNKKERGLSLRVCVGTHRKYLFSRYVLLCVPAQWCRRDKAVYCDGLTRRLCGIRTYPPAPCQKSRCSEKVPRRYPRPWVHRGTAPRTRWPGSKETLGTGTPLHWRRVLTCLGPGASAKARDVICRNWGSEERGGISHVKWRGGSASCPHLSRSLSPLGLFILPISTRLTLARLLTHRRELRARLRPSTPSSPLSSSFRSRPVMHSFPTLELVCYSPRHVQRRSEPVSPRPSGFPGSS